MWPAFAALRRGSLPAKASSGSGSRTHLNEFMRLISVLWSSFPQLGNAEGRMQHQEVAIGLFFIPHSSLKKWSRWVTLPH
jgi:hypothetical protein